MSVFLLQNYAVYSKGATVSLDNATEASLVGQGLATYVVNRGTAFTPITPADQQSLRDAAALGAVASASSFGMTAGGFNYRTQARPGNSVWTFDDLRPRHIPVFMPDQLSLGAITTGNANVVVSYDTGVKEFGAGSMKIAVAAAVATDCTFRIPVPADLYGFQPKIGAKLHVRIRVSDWSAITRLYVSPAQDAGIVNRYIFVASELSGVDCDNGQKSGHPTAWNDVFRTVQFDGYRRVAVGAPAAWLTDASMTATYTTDGIVFTLRTSDACDIYIDRIYSPEWPCGVYTMVGDGCYDTFQSRVIAAFDKRGWKCGVSAFKVSGGGQYPDNYRGFPTAAQLQSIADRGHDVFPHYSLPNGSFNHGETAFSAATTPAQVRSAATAMVNRAARDHRANAKSLQYAQFLQNAGRYNSNDLASLLKPFGPVHGRGPCSDAEFGIDPFSATLSSAGVYRGLEAGNNKSIMAGWIPKRGRFNWGFEQAWFANATADNETDRLRRDTYAGEAIELAVNRADAFGDGVYAYTHYVEDYGTPNRTGTGNPEPSVFNTGTRWWRDHLAHLDEKVAAGRLVVLSPSEKYALTYGRPGDVYLRWDGEWVDRTTGRIAF